MNLRLAEKKARELSDLVEAGDYESAQQLFKRNDWTFGEACEEFVRHMSESGQWEPSTVEGYKTPMKRLISQFGEWPISSVTPKDIEGYLRG